MIKILIPILLILNISCEEDFKLPRNRYDNYKKPTSLQLRSMKQDKKQYKHFMKYLSAGNISSIKEINGLIKYYKSQMNVDKVNRLRYETFIASLLP